MDLQEVKIDLIRLLLETDDKNLLQEIKALIDAFKSNETSEMNVFYKNFRESVGEIKQDLDGESQLNDAKAWLGSDLE